MQFCSPFRMLRCATFELAKCSSDLRPNSGERRALRTAAVGRGERIQKSTTSSAVNRFSLRTVGDAHPPLLCSYCSAFGLTESRLRKSNGRKILCLYYGLRRGWLAFRALATFFEYGELRRTEQLVADCPVRCCIHRMSKTGA